MNRRNKESSGQAWQRTVGLQKQSATAEAIATRLYLVPHVSSTDIPVVAETPAGRRQIGGILVDGDLRIFQKHVRKSQHLMRQLDAWGVESSLIGFLRQSDVHRMRIYDDEEGRLYETSLDNFAARGLHRDYGSGAQVFLPRKHFGGQDDSHPVLPF